MNDADFKKHLKDLVYGHHHPEEHDWGEGVKKHAAAPKKRRTPKKSAKRK
jgi:hypothetical protein